MEAAWKRFMPDLDISLAIHTLETENQAAAETVTNAEAAELRHHATLPNAAPPPVHISSARKSQGLDHFRFASIDAELEQADALEWDESSDLAQTADGIGSLSLDRKGIGYMGPQSGNALLRSLQSSSILLSTGALVIPVSSEPGIEAHVLQSSNFRDKCVEHYFQYFNCAYPILHEGYFRAQYSGMVPGLLVWLET